MAHDDNRMLDLEARRTIFRYVEANPGLHLRGLQRALDIPLGTVEYHLHQMEKHGLLVSREDGRFKAFFVAEGLDRRDKDVLYYVRQEMPRQIIICLLLEPDATHSRLVEQLPVSASTCSFHLKKLVKSGLVVEERAGRSKRFNVADPERAANVLVRYRKSFLDDLVDRFARAWLEVGRGEPVTQGDGEATGGAEESSLGSSEAEQAIDDAGDAIEPDPDHEEQAARSKPLDLARRALGYALYQLGILSLRIATNRA